MAFIVPLVALAAGGLGVAAGIKSLTSGGKSDSAPARPELPVTPTPDASLDQAKVEAARRRQIAQQTGGKTDVTGGTGFLAPSNLRVKNLLGE